MHQISPEALSARENYKLLIGSVIPRPVALVVTQSEAGVVNIAPFSFFNIVSSEPALGHPAEQLHHAGPHPTLAPLCQRHLGRFGDVIPKERFHALTERPTKNHGIHLIVQGKAAPIEVARADG